MFLAFRPTKRQWLFSLLIAVLGTVALGTYWQLPREDAHRFALVLSASVMTICGALWLTRSKRLRCFSLFAGLLLGATQLWGERLVRVGTVASDAKDWALFVICTVCFAPALGALFSILLQAVERARAKAPRGAWLSPRIVFWGGAALLVLLWMPYLLAYYPGLFTYDISWQYQQYTEGMFSTHHPLLHTLLVGWFCDLGSALFGYPSKGLLLHSLFQMIMMALSMSAAITQLYKRNAPKWLLITILLLDGLLPFNALMSISTTKDTLFAGAVLWLCVLTDQVLLEPAVLKKPSWVIRFILALAFAGMLRNNGFICLVAVASLALVLVVRHRAYAKRLLAFALCGTALFCAGNAGLKAAVGAGDGGIQELFSVPIQQLSRVYVMTDDEAKPEIAKYLPLAGDYSPPISDFVKGMFCVSKDQLPQFLQLWLEVGLRHSTIYLDAWGFLIKGFFQLDDIPTGLYMETDFHEDQTKWMIPYSLCPSLQSVLTQLYGRNGYLYIPIFSALISPAFWCWVMLWGLLAALYLRDRLAKGTSWILLMLFSTVLMGPCVMLRYLYPVMLAGPYLWGVMLLAQAREETPKPQTV